MRRWQLIAGALGVAATAGVVAAALDSDRPPRVVLPSKPTAACDAAMREFDADENWTLMHETLEVCVSVEDWLAAYRDHPVEIGGRTDPSVDQVRLACGEFYVSTVCVDGAERGLIPARRKIPGTVDR